MDTDTLTTPSHFYELQKCSGTLIFIIDDCEPCCMKFDARITLKVILDDNADFSNYSVGNSNKIQLQFNNSNSTNTLRNLERHGSFELGGNHRKDNEDEVNSAMAIINPPCFDDDVEGLDGNENGQKVKMECELSDYTCIGNTSTNRNTGIHKELKENCIVNSCHRGDTAGDIQIKEVSVSIPRLESTDLKNFKGRTKSKKARTKTLVSKGTVKKNSETTKGKKMKDPKGNKSKRKLTCENKLEYMREELKTSDVQNESKGRRKQPKPQKVLISDNMKCEYCDVIFHSKNDFHDHKRNKGSVFKCDICNKVEAFEAHLLVHKLSHEPDKGYVVDNDGHRKKNNGKRKRYKKKCSVCGKICSDAHLRNHMMLHTKESAYCCCVCNKNTFPNLSMLHQHLEGHKGRKRVRCLVCKMTFTSRSELFEHRTTHEIKCGLCGEAFQHKTSRRCHYLKVHPNEIKKCPECWAFYPTDEELQKHILYHRKCPKEQCPRCGVVVKNMKDHMLAVHSEEKLFVCDQCPMKYKNKNNLTKHLRVHTGERPYACNLCPKSFRCSVRLRKHLMTHSSDRPFFCEICYRTFTLHSKLVTHMKIHPDSPHMSAQKESLMSEQDHPSVEGQEHSFDKERSSSPQRQNQPLLPELKHQVSSMQTQDERENTFTSILSATPILFCIPPTVAKIPDSIHLNDDNVVTSSDKELLNTNSLYKQDEVIFENK